MSSLPSGTVTFLFTDVEGSTRLLHELGAEDYADALAEHRCVIREACSTHGGVEVDTQGDAFFFAFPTAPGALAAASAFTEALASGPIQVRVGSTPARRCSPRRATSEATCTGRRASPPWGTAVRCSSPLRQRRSSPQVTISHKDLRSSTSAITG
jgi:class 3 adenylate cyclase